MKDYAAFVKVFEAGEIDAADFSHMDHVGVAWELLGKRDFLEALSIYANTIRNLAINAGVPDKFNTTITIAFLGVIAERQKHTNAENFEDFIAENSDLVKRNVLTDWYSADRLSQSAAREIFLMPDDFRVSA
ncbi:MAG: hypothetical protein AAF478_09555 [Pseudomonadota bacterium]